MWLLLGICFRARRTGDGQNGERHRGVRGLLFPAPALPPRPHRWQRCARPSTRQAVRVARAGARPARRNARGREETPASPTAAQSCASEKWRSSTGLRHRNFLTSLRDSRCRPLGTMPRFASPSRTRFSSSPFSAPAPGSPFTGTASEDRRAGAGRNCCSGSAAMVPCRGGPSARRRRARLSSRGRRGRRARREQ